MQGKWIYASDTTGIENEVACFRKKINIKQLNETIIELSADTRYILYVNGKEIGQGPIRSLKERWFYDKYDITNHLVIGDNIIAIRVWDYGWSTYQSVSNQGGLIFDVIQDGKIICTSDESIKGCIDKGIKSKTVKRNVNLGFMEYYNANKFDTDWIDIQFNDSKWENSILIDDNWGTLKERELKYFDHQIIRPETIISIKETKVTRQTVSINTRKAFFENRVDANATIISAFVGFYIDSPKKQKGIIAFPNTKWNGMHGDFKIDKKRYAVSQVDRTVEVELNKGKQLFLMEINAKFDDLYAHIEFEFNKDIKLKDTFIMTPDRLIENKVDGYTKIYGGLENMDDLKGEKGIHELIFEDSPKLDKYKEKIIKVNEDYIFYDEYVLSLVKNKKTLKEIPVKSSDNGMLHGNMNPTIIKQSDNDMTIVVDFYDMYLGGVDFTIDTNKNTIIDIYGFENMFEGEIDYTVGLNNSIRYIAKDGYQKYKAFTRLGFRYLMITIRNATSDTKIFEILGNQRSYPVSRNGNFRCNDYLINKIYDISRRTHILCSEDTFTDSPTFEQSYWGGDAQVSALVNTFYFGEFELIKNGLKQYPLSRKYTKLLSALAPTDWETSIPLWTMNWIITIDEYIFNSGDESVVEELYYEVKETLDYYKGFINEDGALSLSAWHMIDWAPMDIYNDGVLTPEQGILAHCFRILKKLAIKVGDNIEAVKCDYYINKLLNYIDNNLWIEDKEEFVDGWHKKHGLSTTSSIQTHMMLYIYDLIVDEKKKEIVKAKLNNKPDNWIDVGSPFMLFYLFEIWHEQGKDQKILNSIRKRWGDMLRYDSSTCWEVFPGFYENSRTRSYCHSWSSAPGYVFIKNILGFTNTKQGFNEITLNIPDVDLLWCEGSIPTPHGKIDVRWSKENNIKSFYAKVPKTIDVITSNNKGWDIKIDEI